MRARADRKQAQVTEQLQRREAADVQRARDIFAAFRANLRDSLRGSARRRPKRRAPVHRCRPGAPVATRPGGHAAPPR